MWRRLAHEEDITSTSYAKSLTYHVCRFLTQHEAILSVIIVVQWRDVPAEYLDWMYRIDKLEYSWSVSKPKMNQSFSVKTCPSAELEFEPSQLLSSSLRCQLI